MAKTNNDIRTERNWERVVNAWIAMPFATYQQISDTAGVDRRTFRKYRNNPDFMKYYHERCAATFNQYEAAAIQKLGELIEAGDFKAVKYQLDAMGYAPAQKIEQKTTTTINVEVEPEE